MEKYRLLRERLAGAGLFDLREAPMAEPGVIELAHEPGYVRAFLEGTLAPAAVRRIGFPWSEGLVRRTLASVGGTLSAARTAWTYGVAGTLAGGTHHAFYGEGSGFCVFNDVAIAIHWMRSRGYLGRAAVVDLDVHQGDGTAALFRDDPGVLTISIHGRNNFPFRKQESCVDIDLPDGTGDAEYLDRLREILPCVTQFGPDVIFFQSGVDALAEDSLGKLSMSHAGLAERDRLVLSMAKSAGVPLVITLGGGYSRPIEHTVRAHAATYLTAARVYDGGE